MKTGIKTIALTLAMILLAALLGPALNRDPVPAAQKQPADAAETAAGTPADPGSKSEADIKGNMTEETSASLDTLDPGEMDDPAEEHDAVQQPVILPEQAGVEMAFYSILGFGTGERKDLFRFTNGTEEVRLVSLSHFTVNGNILSDEAVNCVLEGGMSQDMEAGKLTQTLLLAFRDMEKPDSITCDLEVGKWADETSGEPVVLYAGKLELPVVETEDLSVLCEPACGMRAGEQTLLDQDGIGIRLLGCGDYAGDYSVLNGILEISNQSDRIIPYAVNGVRINGMFLSVYAGGDGKLEPCKKRIATFSVLQSDLEEAGITSISDMSLLVLTNHDQNTGAIGSGGGAWYDLLLAEKGDEDQAYDEGSCIYEDDWIRIGLRGARADWHDDEYLDEPYGYCYWDLAITNKSGENLDIDTLEEKINGKDAESDVFLLATAGRNSSTYTDLSYSMKENTDLPEVSFKVRIFKQGRGTLLHESEEAVVIKPEEAHSENTDTQL